MGDPATRPVIADPPARDVDYSAAAQTAWKAFTRKPVELCLGMLIATVTMALVVTVGAAALGMNFQALEAVRGRDVRIGTALAGYSRFFDSLVAIVLLAIAFVIGGALCVIPGLLAAFFFYWTFMAMANDETLGAVDAMKRAFALAKSNPAPTFVVIIANIVLGFAGGMVAVGFIVTTPLGMLFGAAVFDQMTSSTQIVDAPPPDAVVTPAPDTPPAGDPPPEPPPEPPPSGPTAGT